MSDKQGDAENFVPKANKMIGLTITGTIENVVPGIKRNALRKIP